MNRDKNRRPISSLIMSRLDTRMSPCLLYFKINVIFSDTILWETSCLQIIEIDT